MAKTISYLFYLRTPKSQLATSKSEIEIPIYFRITVDGQRSDMSTGQSTYPANWNKAKVRLRGTNENAKTVNANLDSLLAKAKATVQELIEKGKLVSPLSIKDHMFGTGQMMPSIVQCFQNFVQEITSKIGSDYEPGTLKNYNVTLGHLKEFILKKYGTKDVLLKDLNFEFITKFDLMCKTDWGCKRNSTSAKHVQRIRKVIGIAIANDWLDKDPFIRYKSVAQKASVKFLTLEELKAIEEKVFTIERLDRIRDVFIFSCYTGYAYADVLKFSANDIVVGMDGYKWIYTSRAKNFNKANSKSNVPLLPQALAIIDKYKDDPGTINSGKLLPVITNIKTNAYLKEIADVCGISKNLTFHMARHTFATTVTLTNGVPIETVSAMLGHASIKTTQIYAKVIENKVSADMLSLREKLAPKVIELKKSGTQ